MSDLVAPPIAVVPMPTVPVVTHDGPPTLAQPKTPPGSRGAPRWETEARERVKVA